MRAHPPLSEKPFAIPLTGMSLAALLFFIFLSATHLTLSHVNPHPGLIAGISDLVAASSQHSYKSQKPANSPGERSDDSPESLLQIAHTGFQAVDHADENPAATDRSTFPLSSPRYLQPPLRAPPV